MKNPIRRLAQAALVLLALASMSACSQLKVQVDVLRPEVISARADADAVARVMPEIVAEDDQSVTRVFTDIAHTHFKAYQDIANGYLDRARVLPKNSQDRKNLEGAALSLQSGLTADYREFYRLKEADVRAQDTSLRTLWTEHGRESDPAKREQLVKKLLRGLADRQAIIASVYTMMGHDLDREVSSSQLKAATSSPAVIVTAEKAARVAIKQLFDSGGMIDSRYAYYVVRAPDPDWGLMFDRTVARGLFGNTDIAIKALGPGNFTIKGLSFNPADVAAAASKVGAQTVLLAAQIAGVPVNLSGTPEAGSNGAALATSSSNFSRIINETAKNSEKVRVHRDALMRVAASILQERNSILNGTPAERKASLASIKAVYQSHAARLSIPVNQ